MTKSLQPSSDDCKIPQARLNFLTSKGVVYPSPTNQVTSHTKTYALERRIKSLAQEERYNRLQADADPLLNEFKQWLNKSTLTVTPRSALGKAITYAVNQWGRVDQYLSVIKA